MGRKCTEIAHRKWVYEAKRISADLPDGRQKVGKVAVTNGQIETGVVFPRASQSPPAAQEAAYMGG